MLDHHTKTFHLGEKLQEAGVEFCDWQTFDYDVLLLDTDHPHAAPAPLKHNIMLEAYKRGVTIGLYPHGGMAVLDYDGLRKPFPLSFELVHGEGHKLVYEAIGLKRRVEVIGWSYCPAIGWLTVSGAVSHLLFAPIHPWADGKTILPIHRALNENAYREFLAFDCARKTVRMFGDDEPNGVFERVEGVDYQASDLTLGVDLIDSADGVISYGTFACTALARGKRVAMIYPYPPHMSDDGTIPAATFGEYAELTRYPASISDAPLEELFGRDTSEWERLFVGGPLDVDHLIAVLSEYKRNRAQRRKAA